MSVAIKMAPAQRITYELRLLTEKIKEMKRRKKVLDGFLAFDRAMNDAKAEAKAKAKAKRKAKRKAKKIAKAIVRAARKLSK